MSIEASLIQYGYIIIVLMTFFGGEEFLMLAGFLAHRGYLTCTLIVLSGFVGSLIADQLYFYLGRKKGVAFLDKHPRWKTRADRIRKLMHKHQNLVILLFRFVYGIRAVTPVLLGISKVSSVKFLVLNAIGALSWAIALTALGYFFGHAARYFLDDVQKYELIIIGLIILFGLVIWLVEFRAENKEEA